MLPHFKYKSISNYDRSIWLVAESSNLMNEYREDRGVQPHFLRFVRDKQHQLRHRACAIVIVCLSTYCFEPVCAWYRKWWGAINVFEPIALREEDQSSRSWWAVALLTNLPREGPLACKPDSPDVFPASLFSSCLSFTPHHGVDTCQLQPWNMIEGTSHRKAPGSSKYQAIRTMPLVIQPNR